jgi:threonine dehydrogenase-like Zn-dependent dehydrogenase
MRAVVIRAPGQAEVREVPRPRPAAEQALIRLEGCGVCGSNLPLWEGRPWFRYPAPAGSPGHEGWGCVVAVGKAVIGIEEGDRVAFLSERAFADYDVAPRRALVKIPERFAGRDLPGEPLGCVMNIWRRARVRRGHTVAVVGVGFIGALLVQLAARAGARVIALSRRPFSLELARRMGAAAAIRLVGAPAAITAQVETLTGGAGCDVVIEAIGLQRSLDVATPLVRVRGRLVIAGFHQDGPRRIDMQQWNWRGIDVINAHERDPAAYVTGMRAAIDRAASGRLELDSLLTHRVPLAHAEIAFELLKTRPRGFIKAVVLR